MTGLIRAHLRTRVGAAVALAAVGAAAALGAVGFGRLSSQPGTAAAVVPTAPLPPPPHPPAVAGWTVTDHQIAVDGHPRDYLLARPAVRTSGTLPVVIVLHGRRMGPAQMLSVSGFPAVVGRAVIIYPAGLGESWNAGACCAPAHAMGANDGLFLTEVVHNVLSTQADTSARSVFLAGYSNGGRMAFQMACLRPDLFAAVATVEAVPVASCSSTAHVPLLVIASTGDPLVNVDGRGPAKVVGGFVEPSVDQVVSDWRTRNGCTSTVKAVVTPDLTRTTSGACSTGAAVALDVYVGNGHAWPAGNELTPSAQAEIWTFFRHHLPS